jgi:hypothetical protein
MKMIEREHWVSPPALCFIGQGEYYQLYDTCLVVFDVVYHFIIIQFFPISISALYACQSSL